MRKIKFRAYINGKMYFSQDYYRVFEFWFGVQSQLTGEYQCPIMQYTGLKDKNGKEIYEGDIIMDDQVVTWNDETQDRGDNELFTWGIQNGKYSLWSYHRRDNFEVIGNIYENTELLE